MTVRHERYYSDGNGGLELISVTTSNLTFIPTLPPAEPEGGGGGGGGGGVGVDTSDPCTATRSDTPFVADRNPSEVAA